MKWRSTYLPNMIWAPPYWVPVAGDQRRQRGGSWIWGVWKEKRIHRHRALTQADGYQLQCGSSTSLSVCLWLASEFWGSSSSCPTPALESQTQARALPFYVGAMDPNLGLHSCMAKICWLSQPPSPQELQVWGQTGLYSKTVFQDRNRTK